MVVKSVGLGKGPRGRRVSGLFLALMSILFLAYVAGNAFVLWSYETGFIGSEDLLPAAVSLVESAFGGFFTTLFLPLFGQGRAGEGD